MKACIALLALLPAAFAAPSIERRAVVGAGQQCGPNANGNTCADGLCCSKKGYCGSTVRFCGYDLCDNSYGACWPVIQGTGQCGPDQKAVCGGGNCCSNQGWCGATDHYCNASAGYCQADYGTCWSATPTSTTVAPPSLPTATAGQKCGPGVATCGDGSCCSNQGWCGTTDHYCNASEGFCQSGFGTCWDASLPTANSGAQCGAGVANCATGTCCSLKGYCGTTDRYCSLQQGLCDQAHGECWVTDPTSTGSTSTPTSDTGLNAFQQGCVRGHNELRSQVPDPYKKPVPVTYDLSLESSARTAAQTLVAENAFHHVWTSGENLQKGSGQVQNYDNACYGTTIAAWGAERANYWGQPLSSADILSYGHYTQCVWPETTRIGCALAQGSSSWILVCHYASYQVSGQTAWRS